MISRFNGISWVLVFLPVLLVLGSCKTTENEAVRGPLPNRSAKELWNAQKKQSPFNSVSAKVHVDFEQNGKAQSFSCKLRIQEDSAIWVSIAPLLGIELFRMVITTDSVKLVDRLNKRYFTDSLSVLESMTEVPVSFGVLQSLLTGKLVDLYTPERYRANRTRDHYQLMMKARGKLRRAYRRSIQDIPILHQMSIDRDGQKLIETFLKDLSTGNLVRARYSDHEQVNEELFPKKMEINTAGAGKIRCNLQWSRIKIGEEVNLPFKIPAKYEPFTSE